MNYHLYKFKNWESFKSKIQGHRRSIFHPTISDLTFTEFSAKSDWKLEQKKVMQFANLIISFCIILHVTLVYSIVCISLLSSSSNGNATHHAAPHTTHSILLHEVKSYCANFFAQKILFQAKTILLYLLLTFFPF